MARPSQGWKLRPPRDACGSYTVRFRWDGRDREISTGTTDPERAAREAARIYAREVSIPERARRPVADRRLVELEGAVTRWLDLLRATHDPGTVGCYADYLESHWLPFFEGLHRLTTSELDAYMRERLLRVRARTVRKELSALRGFCKWAVAQGLIGPVDVPTVPERSTGTAYGTRRRAAAIPLSPKEVRAILLRLPEYSTSRRVPRFPIRARFQVGYETGLRPELLDLLSVPQHYRKGATHIHITTDLDKGRWERRIPLSRAARAALDKVCPEAGLIFGKHDYREHIRAAADSVLPPDRAERFCGAHLRSARATHWLDEGASVTGVQFLLGHRRLETTARYVRPAEDAARAIVAPKRRR